LKDDVFLSAIFGIPWKIAQNLNDIDIIDSFPKGTKIDISINEDILDSIGRLIRKGWYLGNTKIIFERTPGNFIPKIHNVEFQFESLKPKDYDVLLTKGPTIFINDRYHLDPNLNKDKILNLYKSWIKNNIETRTKEILIAKSNDKLIGFLSVIESGSKYYFELIGTLPDGKGLGVGKSLIQFATQRYNNEHILVTTQFHNIAMQRCLVKSGYLPVSTEYIYTIHVE